ncbi:MAG: hypothetical protein HKN70_03940 [Gammaproteobacteria bacterium]|nr:hypothetical protein [Gammaproteobacteria bacterium]
MTPGTQTEPLYLALDQGGHASRALVIDGRGQTIADAYVPIATQRGADFHVEHDALELAESLASCCLKISALLGTDTARIVSAGLATQRSSIVCWQKHSGLPLTPVLSWQDRRAFDFIDQRLAYAEQVADITGLVMSPHYGASKLNWCLEYDEDVQAARRNHDLVIGPLASFLVRHLVNSTDNVCDPANASRTLLWDRRTCDWSDLLCRIFAVDRNLLPLSVPSTFNAGAIEIGAHSAPLQLITGDQSAAIYAFGQPRPHTAYINLGTGAFLQWPVGRTAVDVPGLLNSVVFQDAGGPEYVLEGTVNGAGSALEWHGKRLRQNARALVQEGLTELSDNMPPLFLNGISGLGSPYWQSDFQSGFLGTATPGLCAVAILESIAFLLQVNLEKIISSGRKLERIVLTGGLSRVDYLCQVIADLNRTTVVRADIREATAKGTGYLLSRSVSWPTLDDGEFFTATTNSELNLRHMRWTAAMDEALKGSSPTGV